MESTQITSRLNNLFPLVHQCVIWKGFPLAPHLKLLDESSYINFSLLGWVYENPQLSGDGKQKAYPRPLAYVKARMHVNRQEVSKAA